MSVDRNPDIPRLLNAIVLKRLELSVIEGLAHMTSGTLSSDGGQAKMAEGVTPLSGPSGLLGCVNLHCACTVQGPFPYTDLIRTRRKGCIDRYTSG